VIVEAVEGLRYKVVYDVDGTEALVVRDALRPPKTEPKPIPQKPISVRSPPTQPIGARSQPNPQAKMASLVQQFSTEFPSLRLPSLDDFYRPQYAAALQRFGQHDFELLCEHNANKGVSFFKAKKILN
jgi:hypothetical protein